MAIADLKNQKIICENNIARFRKEIKNEDINIGKLIKNYSLSPIQGFKPISFDMLPPEELIKKGYKQASSTVINESDLSNILRTIGDKIESSEKASSNIKDNLLDEVHNLFRDKIKEKIKTDLPSLSENEAIQYINHVMKNDNTRDQIKNAEKVINHHIMVMDNKNNNELVHALEKISHMKAEIDMNISKIEILSASENKLNDLKESLTSAVNQIEASITNQELDPRLTDIYKKLDSKNNILHQTDEILSLAEKIISSSDKQELSSKNDSSSIRPKI